MTLFLPLNKAVHVIPCTQYMIKSHTTTLWHSFSFIRFIHYGQCILKSITVNMPELAKKLVYLCVLWSGIKMATQILSAHLMFQKRLARPISKLLNPFAGGGGYNFAVALKFTQTKLEMPKTKQSTISTFFTAQRRGKLQFTNFCCHQVVKTPPQDY